MNSDSSTEHSGSVADLKRKIKDEPVDQDVSCKYARYDPPAGGGANPGTVLLSDYGIALWNRPKCGDPGGELTKDGIGILDDFVCSVQSENATTIRSLPSIRSGELQQENSLSRRIMNSARLSGDSNDSVIQSGNIRPGSNLSRMTVGNTILPRDESKPLTWDKELLDGKSVLSVSDGLVTTQTISCAPSKEPAKVSSAPAVTNPPKRPSKLHRCRICLKIFASADFLWKHVAQKHSDELNKRTLKDVQDVNKTMNKTSEHECVGVEHHFLSNEHQLRDTEYQFESHEGNFKNSEHQFVNTEHQSEDKLGVVRRELKNQTPEETKMILGVQASLVGEEKFWKKQEEQFKMEQKEKVWKEEEAEQLWKEEEAEQLWKEEEAEQLWKEEEAEQLWKEKEQLWKDEERWQMVGEQTKIHNLKEEDPRPLKTGWLLQIHW